MTWQIDSTARNAMADAYDALINTGAGTATLEIRTGTPPGVGNAATGTLLVSFNLGNPAFSNAGTPGIGQIRLNGLPLTAVAVATGTAGYARLKDRDGNARGEGTVAVSGGDVTISSTSITSGNLVGLTGGIVTMPE